MERAHSVSGGAAVTIHQYKPEVINLLFDKFFTRQISVLKRYDCPKPIVRTLESKRPQVVARAVGMIPPGSKRISFIPVIPANRLSISEQLCMVRNGNIRGCTSLDTAFVTNLLPVPKEEYFVFSVEDGARTLGWTPLFGEKAFRIQPNRRGLSVPETISLCLHTGVLTHHNVDAIMSKLRGKIPFMWLVEREPRLCADKVDASDPRRGIPSCNTMVI